jgi:hypothetical protein
VLLSSTGAMQVQQWGEPSDIPVPGDYDGDGKTDFAVWRPSTGQWWILPSSTGQMRVQQWGLPGDIPVPDDYDGDHKTDIAVWRPSTGEWRLVPSSTGSMQVQRWGQAGDQPVLGDYDGDGKTELGVWRPTTGEWWIRRLSDGASQVQQWGLPGDIPVSGAARAKALTITKTGNGGGSVASSPAGIDCGASCQATYLSATSVVLKAVADASSAFSGWSGDCTGTGGCTLVLDGNKSVTASFAMNTYRLTVSITGSGYGMVTFSPYEITCTSEPCSADIPAGTSVTLTASASGSSSVFTGWSGACTGTGQCTLTMDGAKAVTAAFALQSHTLTVSKTGSGSGLVTSTPVISIPSGIYCGSSCWATFTSRTTVNLWARADSGSTFTGWSGDCTSTDYYLFWGWDGSCRAVLMDRDLSVTANFTKSSTPPPTISYCNVSCWAANGCFGQTVDFQSYYCSDCAEWYNWCQRVVATGACGGNYKTVVYWNACRR